MKRPPFAERHPLWFVALLELAVVMVYLLVGTGAHFARLPVTTQHQNGLS